MNRRAGCGAGWMVRRKFGRTGSVQYSSLFEHHGVMNSNVRFNSVAFKFDRSEAER